MDIARLGLQIDSSGVRGASRDLRDFSRQGSAAARVGVSVVRSLAGLAATFVSLGGIGMAVAQARRFSGAMAEVSTLVNGAESDLRAIDRAARDFSSRFGGSATAQVGAFYQAISAGAGSAAEATMILEQANKLAIGGVTDVTTAVDGLTTALNAYAAKGLTSADASDAMFVGMKAGKTTIGELSGQLGQIVPLASSVGVSFDEVVAGISALTTQGLSTASATVGLRQVLASIVKPTSEATKAAEALGVEFDVQALKAKGLSGFLKDVITATGGNEAAMAKLFGSVEALNAVLAYAGGAGATFADILEDMENKAGATDEAFNLVAQSLDRRMSAALGKLGNLGLQIGQAFLMVLVPALEVAASAAQLVSDNFGLVVSIAGVLAGAITVKLAVSLGATLVAATVAAVSQMIALEIALGATSTAAALSGVAVKGLSTALVVLRGAIITTGIGALVVGAGYLVYQFSRLVTATGGFGNALKLLGQVASDVWEGIKFSAASIPPSLNAIWQTMKAGFASAMLAMKKIWAGFLDSVSIGLGSLADTPDIGGAFEGAFNAVNSAAARAGTSVLDAAGKVDEFNASADAANREATRMATLAGTQISGAFDKLRGAVADTNDEIDNSALTAEELAASLDTTTDAMENAAGGSGKLAKELKKTDDAADEFAETMLNKVVDGVMGVADALVDFVFRGFTDVKKLFQDILSSFVNMIKDMISYAIRNRIMISLGLSGGGAAPAMAGGGGGGLLSTGASLLGGGGGILGGFAEGASLFGSGGLAAGFASLSGGSGLLGGLGSTLAATFGTGGGIGGLFSIGSNALAAGGGIMATLGAALPVIGIVAGIGFLLFNFLKKKEEVIEQGLKGIITMEDAIFSTYKEIETSRFFGLIKSRRTETSRIGARESEPLVMAVREVQRGVMESAETLGISAGVFSGFSYEFTKSLEDLDDAAKQAAIEAELGKMADAMAVMAFESEDQIEALRKIGEGANDTLDRLANSLVSVNTIFDRMGFALFNVSIMGGSAASAIVDLYGTLEAFQNLTSFYYGNFYTEQERFAQALKELGSSLLELGVDVVPASRAAFRSLVDTAYAMGDDALVAGLIKLAPLMAEITQASDQMANSLDANRFVTRQAFEFTASQLRQGNMRDSYTDRAMTDELLRQLIQAVREGNHEIILNTADTANELLRQNLAPEAA
jgi:trimeric autotransporter adhesin